MNIVALRDWLVAHWWLVGLLVSALLNATIFRKRTAEEYARLNPRWAAVIRFAQATGFDTAKVVETIFLFITGGVPPAAESFVVKKPEEQQREENRSVDP